MHFTVNKLTEHIQYDFHSYIKFFKLLWYWKVLQFIADKEEEDLAVGCSCSCVIYNLCLCWPSLGQSCCFSLFPPLDIFQTPLLCLPWNPKTRLLYYILMICIYCVPHFELMPVTLNFLQRVQRWFVQSGKQRGTFTTASDAFSESFFHLLCLIVCVRVCVCVCVCVCVFRGGMFGVGHEISLFNLLNYSELTCGYENL